MKIISLNTASGIVFEPLMEFIERSRQDTDIFCLQEIMSANHGSILPTKHGERTNVLQEISARLPDFEFRFAPVL